MKRCLLYIMLLSFFPLFSLSTSASVFRVQVQPEEVHPGDIVVLKLDGGESASAQSALLDKPINFHAVVNGMLIALVPVDINTVPQQYNILIKQGKDLVTTTITVIPLEVKTINLTVSEEKVTLSPESQKRVDSEYLLQQKIWNNQTSIGWSGQFSRPIETETSTEYGVRRVFNKKRTSIHRGLDFRGTTGVPVKTVNSGIVVLCQALFYGGNTLVVDHGMGLYSVYMHMSGFNVRKGDKVMKEQVVGFVGSSGRATGPHLHLSVKLNGVSVNPESLFKLEL